MYKIIIVGDIAVGKSSIMERYINDYFITKYKSDLNSKQRLEIVNFK